MVDERVIFGFLLLLLLRSGEINFVMSGTYLDALASDGLSGAFAKEVMDCLAGSVTTSVSSTVQPHRLGPAELTQLRCPCFLGGLKKKPGPPAP